MYLYINGLFLKEEEVKLSPFDHGFMYGLGLFETFRTYHGHPFLLDDHFQRLSESAFSLNIIPELYKREETKKVIEELLRLNGLEDGYFRWNVSAGERGVGLTSSPYEQPNTIVYVKPLPTKNPVAKSGQTLMTRRNSPEGNERLKSHHYLNNMLGKRELGEDSNKEGIFLTEDHVLSEGVVSNLFWIKDGQLFTPDLTCSCLNGITRQFLLALTKAEGIPVHEGRFFLEEALLADEVFVTNSIQGVVPLEMWDEHLFPGNKGTFFQWVNKRYEQACYHLWSRKDL
ncbi:4-amino-4-deoxychorismate lyase [Salipaludibacillus keqinensis]|uniref:4-amino-4-deoxychorismate lyase n=1 Tax=Salipaludibacillus keqinensis TaxID=2045207 RepID=A0A323T4L8_9BACI|nr:aminodeoxychorismate lyase [Salipaludibacillus keqinensis]PYZ91572.1 4-amino-4-deoxychorismate lyase [Salipaludibacillus keqinensis]